MRAALSVVAIALFSAACSNLHPASVGPAPDADVCSKACSKLRADSCPEGAPDSKGTTCEQLCADLWALSDALCIADAGAAPTLQACNVRCIP